MKTKYFRIFLLAAILTFSLWPVFGFCASYYESEPNDDYSSATEMIDGAQYEGTISNQYNGDWYRFVVEQPSEVQYAFEHDSVSTTYTSTIWYLEIFDSQLERIQPHWVNKEDRISSFIGVDAGTYYILISGANGLAVDIPYSVEIDATPSSSVELEPNDDYSTATEIVDGVQYKGKISYEYNGDWYRFVVERTSDVQYSFEHDRVSTTSTANIWSFAIYDSQLDLVKGHNLTKTSTVTGMIYLEPDTYYVVVKGSNGLARNVQYLLNIDLPASCEYDVSPADAIFGSDGGQGSSQVTTDAGCSWTPSSDADWIAILSPATASGDGKLEYSVAELPAGSSKRQGKIQVGDARITVVQNPQPPNPPKAIICAGADGSENDASDSINYCANRAHINFAHQGYSNETIYHLTDAMIYEDLDDNGAMDDRDGPATVQNLEYAVRDWAKDAGSLVLYLVGHGGEKGFRINSSKTLESETLDAWLDELQRNFSGQVAVVYDACQSGIFIKKLLPPDGKTRIVVASASENGKALMANEGKSSFSHKFWTNLAEGEGFYDAFENAMQQIALMTVNEQKPSIDLNGNGIGNEKEDIKLAMSVSLGNETSWLSGVPEIGSVSPDTCIQPGEQVVIYAENVVDENDIREVTAMITPPDAWDGPADVLVSDLLTITLSAAGNGRYEKAYSGFTKQGQYGVAIMAEDTDGTISMPKVFNVTVSEDADDEAALLYFPFACSDGFWETELGVANPSSDSGLSGVFTAYDQTGEAVGSPVNVNLGPMGRKQLIVGDSFSSPSQIRYATFRADSGEAVGYQRPRHADQYRAALPAAEPSGSYTIYIPHIASDDTWSTILSLVNTTNARKSLSIQLDCDSSATIYLDPGECRQFDIEDIFDAWFLEYAQSAKIENAEGIAGLELFRNSEQLGGVLIDDRLARTIYYPHIASDNTWETGIVAYNPGLDWCRLQIVPYTESGAPLTSQQDYIPPEGRYFGTISRLELPKNAAWIKIEAQMPITGFELFTTRNGRKIAGYTGVDLARRKGVLPILEQDGATGIAFVNTGEHAATVAVTARDDSGRTVASKSVALNPFEKYVTTSRRLFGNNVSGATHIAFSSDEEVVMFELNASSNDRMIDALPGL